MSGRVAFFFPHSYICNMQRARHRRRRRHPAKRSDTRLRQRNAISIIRITCEYRLMSRNSVVPPVLYSKDGRLMDYVRVRSIENPSNILLFIAHLSLVSHSYKSATHPSLSRDFKSQMFHFYEVICSVRWILFLFSMRRSAFVYRWKMKLEIRNIW